MTSLSYLYNVILGSTRTRASEGRLKTSSYLYNVIPGLTRTRALKGRLTSSSYLYNVIPGLTRDPCAAKCDLTVGGIIRSAHQSPLHGSCPACAGMTEEAWAGHAVVWATWRSWFRVAASLGSVSVMGTVRIRVHT